MIKIHETVKEDGELATTHLLLIDNELAIRSSEEEEGTVTLPAGALEAVMKRFAAPLDPSADLIPVSTLELGHGRRLHHVRHLARYDVIARDFLVYEDTEDANHEATCALANTVSGALRHLALKIRSNPAAP